MTPGVPTSRFVSLSLPSSALTQIPDIHIQGILESGDPKNITCTVPWACKRGTPPTFSWSGMALTSLDSKNPHSPVLTLTPGPQDHGTNLTCRVIFPGAGVSTERTIQLNVSCECQARMARSLRAVGVEEEEGEAGPVILGAGSCKLALGRKERGLPTPPLPLISKVLVEKGQHPPSCH